ncbi:MAG: hypothetical protein ACREBW_01705, partial [Candidatus Micrarchaeaceae archaeon]
VHTLHSAHMATNAMCAPPVENLSLVATVNSLFELTVGFSKKTHGQKSPDRGYPLAATLRISSRLLCKS